MSNDAQALTQAIRLLADAKGVQPMELLLQWAERERKEIALRLSRHERSLRLA